MVLVNSSHTLLKLVTIVLAKMEIKLFFNITRDQMINELRDSVDQILST